MILVGSGMIISVYAGDDNPDLRYVYVIGLATKFMGIFVFITTYGYLGEGKRPIGYGLEFKK